MVGWFCWLWLDLFRHVPNSAWSGEYSAERHGKTWGINKSKSTKADCKPPWAPCIMWCLSCGVILCSFCEGERPWLTGPPRPSPTIPWTRAATRPAAAAVTAAGLRRRRKRGARRRGSQSDHFQRSSFRAFWKYSWIPSLRCIASSSRERFCGLGPEVAYQSGLIVHTESD